MRITAVSTIVVMILASIAGTVLGVDFLIPGISLGSVVLSRGARVSYLVVTESFGTSDSTWVGIEVLSHGGGEVELDVSTAPYPPKRKEVLTVRLKLSDRVVSIDSADEFRDCIKSLRVREGTSRFRKPTREELDDFAIENLFLRSDGATSKRRIADSSLSVPAGLFNCSGIETKSLEERRVSLGGVDTTRSDEQVTRVWISPEVPLWGLVKSRMERRTSMKRDDSRIASERITITESVLLDFRNPRKK